MLLLGGLKRGLKTGQCVASAGTLCGFLVLLGLHLGLPLEFLLGLVGIALEFALVAVRFDQLLDRPHLSTIHGLRV